MAGITSCFIATFVTVTSSQGIRFNKLKVKSECNINFAKIFDVAYEPITERINFKIDAHSENVDKQKLREILTMAEERCSAMYRMVHVITQNGFGIKPLNPFRNSKMTSTFQIIDESL
ncbi:MAG TPA: OsmC family protein [Nitrososphaeraceae archaeon]|nr:OsmC family protein [Nitrososphaeraceae archaeon]